MTYLSLWVINKNIICEYFLCAVHQWALVIVFFLLHTSYYKFSRLKQYPLINLISVYTLSQSLGRLIWILCLGSQKAEIKVLARLGSYLETLGEESASRLIPDVDRIDFLVVIGLRSLFSCQLGAAS